MDQTYRQLNKPLDVQETCLLTESAGAEVVEIVRAVRAKPHPATFIGQGKIDEIKIIITAKDIDVIIFNHAITPAQERNLEAALNCRVLDRTRLILDIFAQRAKSHEGKLQVELAQLKHLSTRLVRGWTHLERQKGGIGLRGPGETQLETDRRLISIRIKSLTKRLLSVEKQRKLRRRSRDRIPVPVITLVGYTNAGKSTLFNKLVAENVYAADQLFATLDPTMRSLKIERFGEVILSDTVGFIQDLPHSLVAAFHSTLEEVKNSTLLLHVIDYSNPNYLMHIDEVDQVLAEIGADDIHMIKVFNKIDQTKQQPRSKTSCANNLSQQTSVFISAQADLGLDLLNNVLYDVLTHDHTEHSMTLSVNQVKLRAQIHQRCQIMEETFTDDGSSVLRVKLSPKTLGWLEKHGVDHRPI